jgi:hypothetical protein
MKPSTMKSMVRIVATAALLFVPVGTTIALAQDAQGSADQQAAVPRSSLTAQQLDNLVAPLALYPDPVLSQVLAASTYPLEVVEANQWLTQNRALTGTALMDAAKQQNWDPSVQALVAFPDVLARLNQDVRWTTDLGNAFLGQQADVMASVQRLRARARANGKLRTTPQENVTDLTEDGQAAIAIQPADPQVVYVPTYDPTYIWGAPAYGYYPPLFYPSYGFGWGFGIPIGGFFGGWGGWGGYGWGFNWFGGGLFINGGFFNHYGFRGGGYGYRAGSAGARGNWAHNYARSSRATGTGGYSRSYNTAAGSRAGAGANNRAAGSGARAGAAAGGGARAGAATGSSARAGAGAGSSARAGGAGQSYRGGANGATNGANRGYAGQSAARSYSAPSSRSYSAPSSSARSYSAPSRGYSSGSAAHSSGGGGGGFRGSAGGGGGSHGGGGGGGSHGGGGRR